MILDANFSENNSILPADFGDTFGVPYKTGGVKMTSIELLANGWVGEESPYSQTVTIDGVTPNSKIDLQPSVEQLSVFHEKDLAFVTENEEGNVTVFAIGDKPQNDYTIQATVMEVEV